MTQHNKKDKGFTVWLTGLPSSGKSTIANILVEELRKVRRNVEKLDADEVRKNLWPELGYSEEDRFENIRRATWLAKTLNQHGVAVVACFISPYRKVRELARREVGSFVEVYVKCPVEVCMERDTKGLYRKALIGEIQEFTGVSAPYEEPLQPEVLVESDRESTREAVGKIMARLRWERYL